LNPGRPTCSLITTLTEPNNLYIKIYKTLTEVWRTVYDWLMLFQIHMLVESNVLER